MCRPGRPLSADPPMSIPSAFIGHRTARQAHFNAVFRFWRPFQARSHHRAPPSRCSSGSVPLTRGPRRVPLFHNESHLLPRGPFFLVPLGRACVGRPQGALRWKGRIRMADRPHAPAGLPGIPQPVRLVLPPKRRDRHAFAGHAQLRVVRGLRTTAWSTRASSLPSLQGLWFPTTRSGSRSRAPP